MTVSIALYLDRARLALARTASGWARRTIGAVRARRGRDFIGEECDAVERHHGVYTELDQAEDRKRVLTYRFEEK